MDPTLIGLIGTVSGTLLGAGISAGVAFYTYRALGKRERNQRQRDAVAEFLGSMDTAIDGWTQEVTPELVSELRKRKNNPNMSAYATHHNTDVLGAHKRALARIQGAVTVLDLHLSESTVRKSFKALEAEVAAYSQQVQAAEQQTLAMKRATRGPMPPAEYLDFLTTPPPSKALERARAELVAVAQQQLDT